MLIWVNQGLSNKCISKSDILYIANLSTYFDMLLGGEREVSNETLEGVYMSSRQCELSTCVFLLCRQHMFQWVLFHVLNSLHLHRLLWLFQTKFYQIHPFLQRNNTYTEGAWKIMALISSRLLFLSQIAILPPCMNIRGI